MNLHTIAEIALAALLVNNIVLERFLGLCPLFSVSKRLSGAIWFGIAATIVMTLSSMVLWLVSRLILAPLSARYLEIAVFVPLIASLVLASGHALERFAGDTFRRIGVYFPLLAVNCAIIGVALIGAGPSPYARGGFSFVGSAANGFASGIGFLLVSALMAGMQERLALAAVPRAMRGAPIALMCAGIMALAFDGFALFSSAAK
jgi:electron transport complex protein RnfA